MKKSLLILGAVCLKINALGMSNNMASGSECHRERGNYVKGELGQRAVYNNWANPIEALRSSGMLETDSLPDPMVSQLPEMINDQPQLQIPQEEPEWYKYINWDPEEPSLACLKEILHPISEKNSVDKVVADEAPKCNLSAKNSPSYEALNTQVVPLQQSNQASAQSHTNSYLSVDKVIDGEAPKCNLSAKNSLSDETSNTKAILLPQSNQAGAQSHTSSHRPAKKSQLAEERSLSRLKRARRHGIFFTRKTYQEITHVSSSTAGRDFSYGLEHGILVESRIIYEKIYTFVKKI